VEITEVRVKLMNDKDEKLQAFCSVTFNDDFVVRDLKIIGGSKGPFVAMPSRKLMDRCPRCSGKNHLRARHCNDCGAKLDPNRAEKDKRGRARLHTDIAHPINSACREQIQRQILEAFEEEVIRSKQPGYVSSPIDEFSDEFDYSEPIEKVSTYREDNFGQNADTDSKEHGEKGSSFDAGIFS